MTGRSGRRIGKGGTIPEGAQEHGPDGHASHVIGTTVMDLTRRGQWSRRRSAKGRCHIRRTPSARAQRPLELGVAVSGPHVVADAGVLVAGHQPTVWCLLTRKIEQRSSRRLHRGGPPPDCTTSTKLSTPNLLQDLDRGQQMFALTTPAPDCGRQAFISSLWDRSRRSSWVRGKGLPQSLGWGMRRVNDGAGLPPDTGRLASRRCQRLSGGHVQDREPLRRTPLSRSRAARGQGGAAPSSQGWRWARCLASARLFFNSTRGSRLAVPAMNSTMAEDPPGTRRTGQAPAARRRPRVTSGTPEDTFD